MSINIKILDSIKTFKNFKFSEEDNSFLSDHNESAGIKLSISSPLKLDQSFEDKKFLVYFLVKKELKESEILQIFDATSRKRIGWCIPINALDSKEHDYKDNEHFLRYAYIGMLNALNLDKEGLYLKNTEMETLKTLKMGDLFHESTALLIISEETLSEQFLIDRRLPALATYGYTLLTNQDPTNLYPHNKKVNSDKVYLDSVKNDITQLTYLKSIYVNVLPYEHQPIFRFFFLYQAIEMLMELIFEIEQSKTIDRLLQAKGDTVLTKDILSEMNQNTSEKKRMSLMVQRYCMCDRDTKNIIDSCKDLLKDLEINLDGDPINLESSLYKVRNFLFHKFHNYPKHADEKLEVIVLDFLEFLSLALAKFCNPYTAEKTDP